MAALRIIQDEKVLKEILLDINRPRDLRMTALSRVDDPGILKEIISSNDTAELRAAAVEKLGPDPLLSRIAQAKNPFSIR